MPSQKLIELGDLREGMYLVDDLVDSLGRVMFRGGIHIVTPEQIAVARKASNNFIRIDIELGSDTDGNGRSVDGGRLVPVQNGPSVVEGLEGAGPQAGLTRTANGLQQIATVLGADARPGGEGLRPVSTESITEDVSDLFDDADEEVPFQEELLRAEGLLGQAASVTREVLEVVCGNHRIDLPKVQDVTSDIVESLARNGKSLPALCQLMTLDQRVFEHSVHVCVLSALLARSHGVNGAGVYEVAVAGLLHDIGKVRAHLSALGKRPSSAEQEPPEADRHPGFGVEILKASGMQSDDILAAVYEHHQPASGGVYWGQPRDASGHLYGRILALADAYDRLLAGANGKKPMMPWEAILTIFKAKGTQFDSKLAYTFIAKLGIYPVTSFVKTSLNHLGIVAANKPQFLLHPKIAVVFDERRVQLRPGERVMDLAVPGPDAGGERASVVQAAHPGRWNVSPRDFLLATS